MVFISGGEMNDQYPDYHGIYIHFNCLWIGWNKKHLTSHLCFGFQYERRWRLSRCLRSLNNGIPAGEIDSLKLFPLVPSVEITIENTTQIVDCSFKKLRHNITKPL